MKRLIVMVALAAAACSPSMPAPPEAHYIVKDMNGTEVLDIGLPDDSHRNVVYFEDTTMHSMHAKHSSSGMWDYYDDSQKNVLDTKRLSDTEFTVRGLSSKDPNDKSWYILWWVKIEPTRILIANNRQYEKPAQILPDKVLDIDGNVLGSVAGMDVKDAAGKTLYHVSKGPPCACYGVFLLDGVLPMRRAGMLQRLLDGGK